MRHKTLKHQSSGKAVHTIPQLRRLFEEVEHFVDSHIAKRLSRDALVKEFRKEWKRLFMKELDKKSADAFIDDRMKSKKILRHTRKQKQGGGAALQGAPLDYPTRPGVYLESGQIPDKGQLPVVSGGGFGSYIDYVHSGFWNPQEAKTYDPIVGQSAWPQPYASTGSNAVISGPNAVISGPNAFISGPNAVNALKGGSRRKLRGGNAFLTQAFTRPIPSTAPPNPGQDMQTMFYGGETGASPDQVQRTVNEVYSSYKVPIL
jgi:hypothetical protein